MIKKSYMLVYIAILGSLLACNSLKIKNEDEIYMVLNSFGEKSKSERKIYYAPISESSSSSQISWKEIINEMGIVVTDYSENHLKEWAQSKDSLLNRGVLTSAQKDSIRAGVKKDFEIIPSNLLTDEDKQYMLYQLNSARISKWNKKDINTFKISHSKTATKISIPLFTKDQKSAIIFTSSPGKEGLEFCKKINKRWKFYFGSTLLIE